MFDSSRFRPKGALALLSHEQHVCAADPPTVERSGGFVTDENSHDPTNQHQGAARLIHGIRPRRHTKHDTKHSNNIAKIDPKQSEDTCNNDAIPYRTKLAGQR